MVTDLAENSDFARSARLCISWATVGQRVNIVNLKAALGDRMIATCF